MSGAILALVVAVASSFKKRWFCLYLCPTGFLLENTSRVGLAQDELVEQVPAGREICRDTHAGGRRGGISRAAVDGSSVHFQQPLCGEQGDEPDIRHSGLPRPGGSGGSHFGFRHALVRPHLPAQRNAGHAVFDAEGAWTKLTASATLAEVPLWLGVRSSPARAARCSPLGARRLGAARYRKSDTLLRPPGAVPEDRFAGLCIRCNNCVHACPSKIIHPDTGHEGGLGGLRCARHSIRHGLQILPGNVQRLHPGLPHRAR